jgi:hypothetical protein
MKYKVSVNGFDKKVCKQAFSSLHGISNRRLIQILEKKRCLGSPGTDMRGKRSNCSHKTSCENIDFVKLILTPYLNSTATTAESRYLIKDTCHLSLTSLNCTKCTKKNVSRKGTCF